MTRTNSPRSTLIRSRILRAGFALAPILYMLGLIGVTSGVLFSGYSQIMRANIAVSDSVALKGDLTAATNTIASASQVSKGTILCPPPGASASDSCKSLFTAPVPQPLKNIGNPSSLSSDNHAPTYFNGSTAVALNQSGIQGTASEVGIFAPGYGVKQLDPWGHYYIYCRWEQTVPSASGSPTAPSVMVISAGADGELETSCNNTGVTCNLLQANSNCDDIVSFMNVSTVFKQASLWVATTSTAGTAQVSYGATPVNVDTNGDVTAPGFLSVTGTSTLNGAVIASSTLAVTGAITGSSSLAVTGTSNLYGNTQIGTSTVAGSSANLNVTGTSTLSGFVTTGTSASIGGKLGVNVTTPQNTLDVSGNAVIGSYAGSSVSNTNGLVVSGSMGVGTSAPAQALEVNGVAKVDTGLMTGLIYPAADSTSAIKFGTSSGSSTVVMNIDTTNKRVGVGTTPSTTFEVNGTSTVDNNSIIAGSETIGQTSLGTTKLYVAGDIMTTGKFYGSGSGLTTLTVPTSAINASGTPSSSTFLRGDGTWANPSSSQVNLQGGTSQFVSGDVLPIDFGGTGYGSGGSGTGTVFGLISSLFSNDASSASSPGTTIPTSRLPVLISSIGAGNTQNYSNIYVDQYGRVTSGTLVAGAGGSAVTPSMTTTITPFPNAARSSTVTSAAVLPSASSFSSAVPVACLNTTTAATSPCTNVGIIQPSGAVQWSGGPYATLAPGDSFELQMTTPSTTVTPTTITVYVGGSSASWLVTTASNTPAAFQTSFVWASAPTNSPIYAGGNTSTLTGYAGVSATYYTVGTTLTGYSPPLTASCSVASTFTGTTPTCTIYLGGVSQNTNSIQLTSSNYNNQIGVSLTAPNGDSTSSTTTLTVGQTTASATLLTGNSPQQFSFSTSSPVSLGASVITSSTITGIATAGSGESAACTTYPTNSACTLNSTYGGTYSSALSGVLGGSTIYVKEIAPTTYSTSGNVQSTTGTVTIGSTSATWTVTALQVPDAFTLSWATSASPPQYSLSGSTLVGYAGAGNSYVTTPVSLQNYTASASAPLPVYCSISGTGSSVQTCKVSTSGNSGPWYSSTSLYATGGSVSLQLTTGTATDTQPSTVSLIVGTTSYTGARAATAVFSTSNAPTSISLSTTTVSNITPSGSATVTFTIPTNTIANSGTGETMTCSILSQTSTGASCLLQDGASTGTSVTVHGGDSLSFYVTPSTSVSSFFVSATASVAIGGTSASLSAYNSSPATGQIVLLGSVPAAYVGSYTAGASTVNLFIQACDAGQTYTSTNSYGSPAAGSCSGTASTVKFASADNYIAHNANPYVHLGTTDGKYTTQAWLYYISSQTTSLSTYASFPSTTNGTSTIVANAGSAEGTPTVINACTSLGAGWHVPSSNELITAHTVLATSPATSVPMTIAFGYWTSDFGSYNGNGYQSSFSIGDNSAWTTVYTNGPNFTTYATNNAGQSASYRCAYY